MEILDRRKQTRTTRCLLIGQAMLNLGIEDVKIRSWPLPVPLLEGLVPITPAVTLEILQFLAEGGILRLLHSFTLSQERGTYRVLLKEHRDRKYLQISHRKKRQVLPPYQNYISYLQAFMEDVHICNGCERYWHGASSSFNTIILHLRNPSLHGH